ncbi:MAG: hypothetical protein M9962_06235 [Oligoflexia bacterium]|nr:hypothetical protein [Oligoflexia bacterium]
MNEHELEKIRAFEEDHWWYRSLHKYSLAHLRDLKEETIIDLGCGTGFFLKKISKISSSCKLMGFDILENESVNNNIHIQKKKIQICLDDIKPSTVSYIFCS